MEMNEVLAKLPKHLLSLVMEQPYDNYTYRDHAIWRYVMRQNLRYLPQVTHASYQAGLPMTELGNLHILRQFDIKFFGKSV